MLVLMMIGLILLYQGWCNPICRVKYVRVIDGQQIQSLLLHMRTNHVQKYKVGCNDGQSTNH